jgi:hypothetical protein
MALLEVLAQHAHRFDIIHCHVNWIHLPLVTRLGVPFLTTLHNRLDTSKGNGGSRIWALPYGCAKEILSPTGAFVHSFHGIRRRLFWHYR